MNDAPAPKPRPLNVISAAWRAGFWISREEEAVYHRFVQSVKKMSATGRKNGKGKPSKKGKK